MINLNFLTNAAGIVVLSFWFVSIPEWDPLKISLIILIVLLLFDFIKQYNKKKGKK